MLGAFALGIVMVAGWTALVSEAVDLTDRVRRARCDWVDPIVVTISGHTLSVDATPGATIFTGTRWLSGEELTGYRRAPVRYGFCLDALPDAPISARAVTLTRGAAQEMLEQAGLPPVAGPLIEIGDAGLFLSDAPQAVGTDTEVTVFYRNEDFGWPHMATKGLSPEGFRIGAICRDVSGGGWLCDVSVQDTQADLSYRFERLPIKAAAFDAAPVPGTFLDIAHSMRRLVQMLNAKTVALR